MNLLAVDTSGPNGAVGLGIDGKTVAETLFSCHETYSARLLPVIDSILKENNLSVDVIDMFGVVIGPGSFTGLRVGLATIKGLAWANQKPMVGISSLEVLAHNLRNTRKPIIPMLDARKQRVYGAIYQ